MPSFLQDPAFWKLASIPVVAAVVGWATNWVAIKLTFQPLRFIGIRPYLGWQGIIPSKAEKMAATFVDSTMHRLGSFPELFESMDPERMATHITEVIVPRLHRYTDEVMFWGGNGTLWRNTPQVVKEAVYERVRDEMPRLIRRLMADAGQNIEELVDFRHMVVSHLVEDRELLNRLFLESGSEEFKFIVRSGFYFGFLFGLVQLAVWIVYPAWWVLPLFGLLVGWATNWIALNLIFRPLHPKKIGPWTLHGLFLRRQKEVAEVWCRLVTREVVSMRHIIHSMMTGPKAYRAEALIRSHIEPVADEALGALKPAAQVALGLQGFAEIKATIGDKAVEVSTEPFDNWQFNEDRSRVVEELLRERMESMPSEQFQDLLRPCFQEDETKLILAGAILGLLAGFAQLLLVFGGLQ